MGNNFEVRDSGQYSTHRVIHKYFVKLKDFKKRPYERRQKLKVIVKT